MKKLTRTALIATAIATAALAASAQGMMGGGMGENHHGMGRMDPARMEKMVARHLDDLKAKLKITAAQEAAWTTFAAAMKPDANLAAKRPDFAELDKLSTPERLDKMRELHKQRMAEMETHMGKRDDAIKAFYATLSADQKKVFDAEHARMGRGRHGKGAGPMGAGPMGGGNGPQAKP